MKPIICNFQRLANNTALMSLNRFIYVLKSQNELNYKIETIREHEGTVHFALFEAENLVAMTDESQKLVHFYQLHDIVTKGEFTPIRTQ